MIRETRNVAAKTWYMGEIKKITEEAARSGGEEGNVRLFSAAL